MGSNLPIRRASGLATMSGDIQADEVLPVSSAVNCMAGAIVKNSLLPKLSFDGRGQIKTYTSVGQTDLILDVNGFFEVAQGLRPQQ